MRAAISRQQFENSGFQSIEALNHYLNTTQNKMRQAIEHRDFEEAEGFVRAILKIIPDHIIALSDLSLIKRQQGQLEEAYALGKDVLDKKPKDEKALDSLVSTCYRLNHFEEALYHAKRAIKLKQEQAQSYTDISLIPLTQPKGLSPDKTRNIISYSLFGQSPRYCEIAVLNAKLAQTIYPQWTCRFYIDDSVPQLIIQRLEQAGAQIHFVKETNQKYSGLFWRFFVMDDPNVDCFIIRDADSLLSYKEKAAVDEWLNSDKWFHVMRDAIEHCELILAGMWGGRTGVFSHMQETIENYFSRLPVKNRSIDQVFLRKVIYPTISQSLLVHDNHNLDGSSRAFPDFPLSDIEKIPYFHIGMIDSQAIYVNLPKTGKPSKTLHWLLKDEQGRTVCTYDIDTDSYQNIPIHLPYFYREKVNKGEWSIEIVEKRL